MIPLQYMAITQGQLQWGRDLSIAEMELWDQVTYDKNALQWGRDLSIAEIAALHPTTFQRARARFASGWAARPADDHYDLQTTTQIIISKLLTRCERLPYFRHHLAARGAGDVPQDQAERWALAC
jgi:hypothetical protein